MRRLSGPFRPCPSWCYMASAWDYTGLSSIVRRKLLEVTNARWTASAGSRLFRGCKIGWVRGHWPSLQRSHAHDAPEALGIWRREDGSRPCCGHCVRDVGVEVGSDTI